MGFHPFVHNGIDLGIKDLVYALNSIPFVSTQESCEGHLNARESIDGVVVIADEGFGLLSSGFLEFSFDEEHERAHYLVHDMTQIEFNHPIVSFRQLRIRGNKPTLLSYRLCLATRDLPHQRFHPPMALPEDRNQRKALIAKLKYQVPLAEGEKRIAEYQQVWADLLRNAVSYLE